jgi:predicted nucleic acid-binding protein
MATDTNSAYPITLDTSCWLEVFSNGVMAHHYLAATNQPTLLVVPVITIYEVFKQLLRLSGKETALQAVAWMEHGHVVEINRSISLEAASNGLPMADSLIYATAQLHHAELWTQDAHFEGLAGVKYFSKAN